MRILLLSDFYPPVVGGVEQHVRTLAHALAARGHRVAVATVASGDGLSGSILDGPVAVHRLGSTLARLPGAHAETGRPFTAPAPDPGLTVGLARLAREFRPDIVHAHSWLVHSWLPLRAAVPAPLVVTLHEYGLACAKKSLVRAGRPCDGPGLVKCATCAAEHYGPARGVPVAMATLLGGPVLRRAADAFIAVSDAVARGSGLARDRARVIPNMLPPSEPWLPASLGDRLPAGPFVLFVGALGVHKGIEVLFDAWLRLVGSRARAGRVAPALACIGHRWADTPRDVPAGVVILEDWPHGAVLAAWDRAVLGVIPSTWPEPFGIVALEAMAAGRAVVASRIGGLADVVRDGETGLLVEPGDPAALAGALGRLLDDDPLRDRLGRGGRAAVAMYAADAVVPRIEAVYAAALGRSRPGGRFRPGGPSKPRGRPRPGGRFRPGKPAVGPPSPDVAMGRGRRGEAD